MEKTRRNSRRLVMVGIFFLLIGFANGEERVKYYDKYGGRAGSSSTSGNVTKYYDKYGRSAGSAYTNGNRTTITDKYGSISGGVSGKFTPQSGYKQYFQKGSK